MNEIALADFGSAKFIGDEKNSDYPALSKDYCAPELTKHTSI